MLRRFYSVGLSCNNFYSRGYIKHYKTACSTSDSMENKTGMSLKETVDIVRKFADMSLAASWDNVGLLIEPTEPKIISCILFTNDLTEDVMDEAIKVKADIIIAYHPLIFTPLKTIATTFWKERIVARCLENRIAVLCPHTTIDSIKGGINDWLAEAFEPFGIASNKPIQPDKDNPANGHGRICTVKNPISVEEAVNLVKQRTNLKHVRLARGRGSDGYIATIAICAGSGTSVLKGTRADLYLTGEMLHHDVLDAVHQGTNVILTNHSDSERGFLKKYASILNFPDSIKVCISEVDSDPLQTV